MSYGSRMELTELMANKKMEESTKMLYFIKMCEKLEFLGYTYKIYGFHGYIFYDDITLCTYSGIYDYFIISPFFSLTDNNVQWFYEKIIVSNECDITTDNPYRNLLALTYDDLKDFRILNLYYGKCKIHDRLDISYIYDIEKLLTLTIKRLKYKESEIKKEKLLNKIKSGNKINDTKN